jgi:hypothetical protein
MSISEDELRAMVRAAVARQSAAPIGVPAEAGTRGERIAGPVRTASVHASHGLIFTSGGGGDDEGRCLIEPGVACTHCGYCQSLGH